jgi:hypothetical protein
MSETVTKSISMPPELFREADAVVKGDPELDWSKYVRRLIRKDLEQVAQPELALPALKKEGVHA